MHEAQVVFSVRTASEKKRLEEGWMDLADPVVHLVLATGIWLLWP